jgi:hypothetical protein
MTFYYFINCVALTFAPLVFLYKFTSLSEYGSIWRSGMALAGYIITQMIKLLVISTVMVPPAPLDYAIDCLGLYYLLTKQQKASLTEVKVLSVALGWSFGESLLTRFVDFYVNARSMQFDWKHLLVGVDSNLVLVQNVCICTLLWLTSRSGSKKLPSVLILAYLLMLSVIGNNLLYKGFLIGGLSLSTLLVAA